MFGEVENCHTLVRTPNRGYPFKFRPQTYHAKKSEASGYFCENRVLIALVLLSQYTHVSHDRRRERRRQTDGQHIMTVAELYAVATFG